MLARFLMGHKTSRTGGAWKKSKDGSRPTSSMVLHREDVEHLKSAVADLGAKTILEFGPGLSTEVFDGLGLQVTTVEHHDKWYEVAKERFKDKPNVRVLKGEDEMPFRVPELDDAEKFDMAFVDAPQGYFPMRKVHEGYEDCSRFNTTIFALQHAPVVFLHDAIRPLERGTLCRLKRLGYQIETIRVPLGMAKITWPQGQT
jgi:predicted O-methyltransferase YrrM